LTAEIRNLSWLAVAQGFTHWLYKPSPSVKFEDTLRPGYFSAFALRPVKWNEKAAGLAHGDTLTICCADGTGIRVVQHEQNEILGVMVTLAALR